MNLNPLITIAFVDNDLGVAGLALALLVVVGVLALVLVFCLAQRNRPKVPKATAERVDAVVPAPITPEARQCPQCGAALPQGVLDGLCPACLLLQGASPDSGTQPKTAPFVPPAEVEIARLFPQLEVIELIGKGGMGAVYKARQPALDRLVALKILPAQAVGGVDFAERFNREARALAKLNHPNIVGVYEFGQMEALHYFIMEYVDGANLRQLERNGRLSPRQALKIIPEICDALQYAHDEGVVHRDIKPENVLIDRKGRVKIADFGLAKILGCDPQDLRLTGAGQVMGTPHYMAPEQIEHPLEVDHRADIYSLGVVFYEMLTGELPLGRFAPPSRKVRVDVRLDEVVLHALEKEPERRYQHASEVGTAVDTIARTLPQSSIQPEPQTGKGAPEQPFPRWLMWAPFQSAQVREICAHMTDAERREAQRRRLLFGFWNAATLFVPFFVIMGVPAPRGWGLGAAVFLLGLSFYPLWRRMEREHLCGTAWARQQGITPDQVKGSAGRGWAPALVGVRNGRRVIHWPGVLVAAALLALAAVVAVWVLSAYYLGPSAAQIKPSVTGLLALVVVGTLLPLAFVWSRAQPLKRLSRPDRHPPDRPDTDPAPAVNEELLRQVRQPAMGLFAAGAANWVLLPLIVMPFAYLGLNWQGMPRLDPAVAVALLLSPFVLSGIVFVAALRMMRLQSYGLAVAAAILAMVVTPGNIIGFPIGVWALVVLLRSEVRAAFGTGRPLPVLGRPAISGGGNGGKKIALIIFGLAMAALVLLALALVGLSLMLSALAWSKQGRSHLAPLAPPAAAVVPSENTRLSAPARNAVVAVRCGGRKATIEVEVDDAHEVLLFVGTEALGWSSWCAGTTDGRATVEASDQIKMEDGSLGRGFTFQAEAARHDVAITPDGPVPFGELVFRPDGEITQEAGTFTFADIHQADGTRVPISVRIRPVSEFPEWGDLPRPRPAKPAPSAKGK